MKGLMKKLKQAVISIYYKDKFGQLHYEPQGKFFYLDEKPVFLADMTDSKLWRKFNGYSIAKRLLEAFADLKIKPQIIYRLKTKGTLYYAKSSYFTTKGILVAYGDHQQYILPVKNFDAKQGSISGEPMNLPKMRLEDWKKSEQREAPQFNVDEKVVIAPEVRMSLSEMWKQTVEQKSMKGALN
jgi:hypothetical protein